MNKRVNITYSVEFDDILKTVGDMLQKKHSVTYRSLDKDFNDLLVSLTKDREREAIKKVDEMRIKLFNVDLCLSDCSNILKGYRKELLESTTSKKEEKEEENESG